jgi:hypothetical protein
LGDVLNVINSEQNDGQIAGYAVRPKTRLPRRAARNRFGRCSKARIGVKDGRGQALKIRRLFRADIKVAQLNLRLRPRQDLGPIEGVAVMVPVDEV